MPWWTPEGRECSSRWLPTRRYGPLASSIHSLRQSSLIVNVPSVVFASDVHIRGSCGCTGVASATVACGACPWRRRRNEKHRKRYHHHDQQGRRWCQQRRKHRSVVGSCNHRFLPYSGLRSLYVQRTLKEGVSQSHGSRVPFGSGSCATLEAARVGMHLLETMHFRLHIYGCSRWSW